MKTNTKKNKYVAAAVALSLLVAGATSAQANDTEVFFGILGGITTGIILNEINRDHRRHDYRRDYRREHNHGKFCWTEQRGYEYDPYIHRRVPRYVRVCEYR